MTDIIIIGGGTAGLTAAVYALRAGKSVLVLEGAVFGGQIASSPCVENYPGIASVSGLTFADTLLTQALDLGAAIDLDGVASITPKGHLFSVQMESNNMAYEAKSVIIATGAKHRTLGLANEERLTGKGISYCAVCDGAFFKDKNVAVMGGGSAALQTAQFLANICESVTLIHRRDTFRGEDAAAARLRTVPNVSFLLEHIVTELHGEVTLSAITVQNTKTEATQKIPLDGLFIAIGQAPANENFSNVVTLDDAGYIVSNESCTTATHGVFAAGDCRAKTVRQLTTAAADGTVAALAACAFIDRQ